MAPGLSLHAAAKALHTGALPLTLAARKGEPGGVPRLGSLHAAGVERRPVLARTKKGSTEGAVESGVVFEPFVEVASQLAQVPGCTAPSDVSFARQHYSAAAEAGVNEQIK